MGNIILRKSASVNGQGNEGLEVVNTSSGQPADLTASRVWNAVWNDVADYQELVGELIYGKCYVDTYEGLVLSTERCQLGVAGIASDTFGYGVGVGGHKTEVPIAVAGWVLAYVDKEYPSGTPLTNDEYGLLTEMTKEEKRDYPERLIATFKRPERQELFGPENSKISVNGRCWVKVR